MENSVNLMDSKDLTCPGCGKKIADFNYTSTDKEHSFIYITNVPIQETAKKRRVRTKCRHCKELCYIVFGFSN